jgi:multidrug efflux pump subunit AcrA (membrane-fusion protein)
MKEFWHKHHYAIVTSLTIAILLIFSYQVMAYLFSLKGEPERPVLKPAVRSVLAKQVVYSDIQSPVKADGRVVSTQEVSVSSEVRGKILEGDIPLKKGQSFRKGAVLIRIFNQDVAYTLKSGKSQFLQTIAGILPDIKVDFPENYDTWMNFFRSIDIDTDLPDLPHIQSEQERIFLVSRNVLTQYYLIKSDEINLRKHVIVAPFNGSFTTVMMEVGAIANTGTVLAKIIRTDRLELEVPLKTDDAYFVQEGDEAIARSEDGSLEWKGKIVRKSDFIDPATQSISIFVGVVPTRDKPLYAGEYLKVEFPGKVLKNTMEIPRNAVFNSNEVFIVESGKLVKTKIDIQKINDKTLLFSGLQEGVELVVEPLVNALENTSVEILR